MDGRVRALVTLFPLLTRQVSSLEGDENYQSTMSESVGVVAFVVVYCKVHLPVYVSCFQTFANWYAVFISLFSFK